MGEGRQGGRICGGEREGDNGGGRVEERNRDSEGKRRDDGGGVEERESGK